MDYSVVMPRLSDSMEEGKLISWKVREGDRVEKRDVIAEVESDKAVMEVQAFKDGVVKKILVKEGESVPVGKPIAVIESEEKKESEKSDNVKKDSEGSSLKIIDEIFAKAGEDDSQKAVSEISKVKGKASPKAKREALKAGMDIEKLQEEGKLPSPAHFNDIKEYERSRYFTPKAWKLLKEYGISYELFDRKRKHDEKEVYDFIKSNDIPLKKRVDPLKKAIIKNVTASSKRPVYRIFDFIDTSLIEKHKEYSFTVWFIKIVAIAMMEHEGFRSVLEGDFLKIYPNASVSVAVALGDALFMPVFKKANLKSVREIDKELKEFKEKISKGGLKPQDMEGSTFGISNLGMLGIFMFDAMINKNDSAVAAVGAARDFKAAVTLTIDHRLVNGYEGALFMKRLKELSSDPMVFK